jgi:hypothetical protein
LLLPRGTRPAPTPILLRSQGSLFPRLAIRVGQREDFDAAQIPGCHAGGGDPRRVWW